MNREDMQASSAEWGMLKFWQVYDPIPYWFLDREKQLQIIAAQMDYHIDTMKRQLEMMEKVRNIVGK